MYRPIPAVGEGITSKGFLFCAFPRVQRITDPFIRQVDDWVQSEQLLNFNAACVYNNSPELNNNKFKPVDAHLPAGVKTVRSASGRLMTVVDSPLVYTAISQRSFLPESFQVFKNSLKITRPLPYFKKGGGSGGSVRGEVTELSAKSKNKLRFKCLNSRLPLISQFCLTYPATFSNDGREVQAHFNAFMTRLRGYFKTRDIDFVYLWVKEFQKRGAPHFHLFLSVPVSAELHEYMANLWNRVAGNNEPKHLNFHLNPSNFIEWDMGNGQYLTKYLEKNTQKITPEEYQNVGRFWGSCRGIVKEIRDITTEEMQELFTDHEIKQVVRWVGKWHENKLKNIKKTMLEAGRKPLKIKSKIRRTSENLNIFHGAKIFRQIINYQINLPEPLEKIPF